MIRRGGCGMIGAMAYRAPPPAPPPSPHAAELDAYEGQLRRRARRSKVIFGLVVGLMGVAGLGTCMGPIVVEVGQSAWRSQKTKLTKEEVARVDAQLAPIEAEAKKSQEAFDAIWPKLRSGAIGARKDLGRCTVDVPGPNIRRKEESTSLQDSAQGVGWTFVDLTPPTARSPIEGLRMPQGSIALNNTGTDRYTLSPRPLRTAPPDRAPTLDSTARGARAAELRAEASAPMRRDSHGAFLYQVKSFVAEREPVDVVVFLDFWADPRFSDARPTAEENLRAAPRGGRPTRLFDPGLAVARAFAWSPAKQEIVCASQALGQSSPDITFRSSDIAPLQQDLVLQLERELDRSFVAVGDAPPRIDVPPRAAEPTDAGAADAAPKKPARPR
jgi:hypothetical protein